MFWRAVSALAVVCSLYKQIDRCCAMFRYDIAVYGIKEGGINSQKM